MIRAQGTETAICLGHGELGTYLCLVDLISIWEAMNKNNKRALLEIHTRISQLRFTSIFTVMVNQWHPFKRTF